MESVIDVNSGQSESSALVDTSFTIEAEWIGTPQWMTGYNYNYETFNGSISRGVNSFGSNLSTSQYAPVEIRLDIDTNNWSNAQIFRRDVVLDDPYDAAGVGTFPGSAWDMTDVNNPRRLNVCFVEWEDGTDSDSIPPPNETWDPDSSARGKYEHLFVMRSSYDSTGHYYDSTNILYDDLDLLYSWWPRVADGHTFFETDTAALRITPHIGLATIPSNTSIELVWAYPGLEPYRFKIFYSDSPNPDQLLVQLTSNAIRYTHRNLLPDQEYYYQMFSYDIDGNEIYSSPVVRARTREVTLEIDKLAQWNLRSLYGDIWGYTDSVTGTEYALLCVRFQGLSIIDITDSPLVEVGFVSGSFSTSDVKDVKTYSHYAVIFCETAPTQIFDIANVTNPVFVSTIPGGRHNGYVDGHYVYLVGGAVAGLQIYSIEDPYNPDSIATLAPNYYHDVAIRNDTMAACAIYGQGVDIIDLTDKQNPVIIGHFNYPNSGPHNAAFSEDGKYVFVGDEIGVGNYTRVFDISDLDNISMVSEIIVNPFSIVHNCYVLGEHLYIASLCRGTTSVEYFRPDTALRSSIL